MDKDADGDGGDPNLDLAPKEGLFTSKKKHRGSITLEDVEALLGKHKDEERFLIKPDHPYLQSWDLAIFVALLFTATVTPFEVSFVETKIDVMFFINRAVDLLFIMDMVLQFVMMYTTENGRLIKSHALIRKRYLRGWFCIDFLTILPFDSAKYVLDSGAVKVVRIVRLLRLLKLLRIVRASRIFTRWETKLGIDHGLMLYIKLSVMLFAMTHWFACFWGLTAFLQTEDTYTWFTQWLDYRMDTIDSCKSVGMDDGTNVIPNGAFRDRSCFSSTSVYLACFQLAVMTITGAGPGGGIEPVNFAENITTSALTLLAGIAWANIIGQICGIAASGDPVQMEFYQTNDDMNRLMRETNIDTPMRHHIRNFLRHSKSAMRERARKSILTNLSPELCGQMAIQGQRWVKEEMVFWTSVCSPAFLSILITKMGCSAFAPKEIIPSNDSMYILKKGTVITTRVMMKSSPQTCWNVDVVLTSPGIKASGVCQMCAARTLTFVEVDVMSEDTFQWVMSEGFPETPAILRRIRWWAVLRFVQYAAKIKRETGKDVLKTKLVQPGEKQRTGTRSPRTPTKLQTGEDPSFPYGKGSPSKSPRLTQAGGEQASSQLRQLTESQDHLTQQVVELTKLITGTYVREQSLLSDAELQLASN